MAYLAPDLWGHLRRGGGDQTGHLYIKRTTSRPLKQGWRCPKPAHRALCAAYRNLHFSSPTSPRDSRRSESSEGARVKTDEEWTTRLQRGTTTAPPQLYHPNSVQSDDGSPLTGLECLQADLCRAL